VLARQTSFSMEARAPGRRRWRSSRRSYPAPSSPAAPPASPTLSPSLSSLHQQRWRERQSLWRRRPPRGWYSPGNHRSMTVEGKPRRTGPLGVSETRTQFTISSESTVRACLSWPRDSCSTERRRRGMIEFRLLLGGRSEAAPDRLICPPAPVSRHARPPQRLGLGEDETPSEGQRAFPEQKPLHAFVAHEPRTVKEPRRFFCTATEA
jgi:hypothetical protein